MMMERPQQQIRPSFQGEEDARRRQQLRWDVVAGRCRWSCRRSCCWSCRWRLRADPRECDRHPRLWRITREAAKLPVECSVDILLYKVSRSVEHSHYRMPDMWPRPDNQADNLNTTLRELQLYSGGNANQRSESLADVILDPPALVIEPSLHRETLVDFQFNAALKGVDESRLEGLLSKRWKSRIDKCP